MERIWTWHYEQGVPPDLEMEPLNWLAPMKLRMNLFYFG